MADTEQGIFNDLISKWVSLGLEYARGAHGVTALYIYAASEEGSIYAEILFEQDGKIDYPARLVGVDSSIDRIRTVHRFQFDDLLEAEERLAAIAIPSPTEYRIFFDITTKKLDMQLSRESMFANQSTRVMENGPREWLGDRIRDVFVQTSEPN